MTAGGQANAGNNPVAALRPHGPGPVLAYLDIAEPGQHLPRVVPLQDAALICRARSAGEMHAEEAPDCAIIGIAEPTVSRRHARIRRDGAGYVIEDLRSVNGTWIEGERLPAQDARALNDGDTVRIGGTLLVFHSLVAPQARAGPATPDAGPGGPADEDAARAQIESRIVGSIDATRYAMPAGDPIGPVRPVEDRATRAVAAAAAAMPATGSRAAPGPQAPAAAAASSASSATLASLASFAAAAPAGGDDASAALLQATVRKLHAMAQVGIALGVVRDRATLVEKLMQFMFDLFPLADRAFMLLCEPAGNMPAAGVVAAIAPGPQAAPVPVAARRRDGAPLDPASIRLSRTILHAVLAQHRALLCADSLSDACLASQDSILAQPLRSIMCVPLLLETECLGLIQVDTGRDPQAFDEDDLELLSGVCAQAAVTLKTFLLYADIERLLDGFVSASVQAIEERDPVTAGHSARVAEYAVRLAQAVDASRTGALREVRFNAAQIREIRYAALLHDFGKVGVREQVLCKEKKLHPEALRLLQERFQTARAAARASAYEQLVAEHLQGGIDGGALQAEQAALQLAMARESRRLDAFMQAILEANEPRISARENGRKHADGQDHLDRADGNDGHADLDDRAGADPAGGLEPLLRYRFDAGDGQPARHLLEAFEFSALCLERGCLTGEERRQIESHVSDTHAFLVLIPWTRELAGVPAIAHAHHEKLDGSGYPRQLRGAQIGVQSRILTICDIYDALTAADRPYKKAVARDAALELMREECRNGHLDGELFDLFVQARAWSPACA